LQTDRVDLLQIHNFTDVVYREVVMRPGGAIEFLLEARNEGLARFIGITGHGILTPKMHMQSLQRFGFNSVLLPCNYPLMQISRYRKDYAQLMSYCRENQIAVQLIKAAARGLWGDKPRTHSTWYEPLTDKDALRKSIHWVIAQNADGFLVTSGDKDILPHYLEAVADFQASPAAAEMAEMVKEHGMQPLFDQ
ncbi:MAG: aldo/keto reductase, partial [Desulfocapsaceae bacterium]|nr:aldo/keto reductase [Desulfocapsaceae bacterium]